MAAADISETGLTVLYEPVDYSADTDIVFVHGLQGHPRKTWSYHGPPSNEPFEHQREHHLSTWNMRLPWSRSKSSKRNLQTMNEGSAAVFWPQDLLPRECPNSRVLTFGYDTRVTRQYSAVNQNNIFTHAKDLLYALDRLREQHRRLREQEKALPNEERKLPDRDRNLIFVAHSLGGIVVKEVLRRSELSSEPGIRDIINSTTAVVFLGTPHRGSPGLASTADVVRRVAQAVLRFDTNEKILRSLGIDSPELELCRESFLTQWRKYNFRVKTFQEALGIKGINLSLLNKKVVPDVSSSLDDPEEHAESIQANHMEMTKFWGHDDPGYKKVGIEISRLVRPRSNNEIECLRALSFTEMMSREMLVKRPMEKTGDWLFSTKPYIDWFSRINVDSTHGILWLKGKPGSGKSTLMKEAVHRTKNYCHPRPIIATCFFNAQGSELEHSPSGLIRSLLMQICRQDESFKNLVVTHYLNAAGSSGIKWNPSLDELQGLLEIGLLEHASKQRFVFFIDALDECGEVHARAITRYFRMLSDSVFTAGKALDVCLSSRHYPTITIPRCPEIAVEEGNGADISSYIQTNIPYGITEHDALVDRLRLLLLQKTSGVFLWIVLVVDMVLQDIDAGKTEEEIEETLREVPVSLAELFKGLLCTLTTKEREGSMILVQWVLLSPTPLQAVDVRTIRLLGTEAATSLPKALAKSQRPGNLSVDWEIDASRVERNVRTLSRGLMEISGIHVRFIHESVREFFLQEGSAVFGLPEFISAGHCMIVRACLYGLCVLENISAMESSESQIFAWIPFYVSRSILYHAIQARHALKLPNQLFHLLRSITKIVASTCRMRDATALLHTGAIQVVETQKASRISVYRIHKDRLLDYHLFSLLISGVSVCNHIFNQLNILSSLRIKLNSDCILDLLEPDSNGWESEYVDFDDESNLLVDGASRPGLFRSIMKHEERQKDKALTRLLDQGADINISDFEGNTALHLAAWQGMELVTDTLLKYNPTNTYNNYGMTPLGLACLYGHKSIVNKLLIHEGHFFQQLQGQDGGTLLHIAAIAEDSSLADILLRAGASPNLPNEFGRTPLHFAIQYGASSELVKLLLLEKYGGDLYWKDQAGLTPLDVAIDLNQLLQEQNPRQLWSGSSTNFEKTLASRNSHRSWVQAGEGMFAPPASHN